MWSLGAYNTAGKTGNYWRNSNKSWEEFSGAIQVVTEGSPQQARQLVVLGNASQKTGCLPGLSKQGGRLCVTCIKCIHSVQIRKEARPTVFIIGQPAFYSVNRCASYSRQLCFEEVKGEGNQSLCAGRKCSQCNFEGAANSILRACLIQDSCPDAGLSQFTDSLENVTQC